MTKIKQGPFLGEFNQFRPGNLGGFFKLQKIILAHLQCFKYMFLAGNNMNRLDAIFNGCSKQTQQSNSNKL